MGKINSRAKGAVGERELASALNDVLGLQTRRGQQYSGIEGEDVVGFPGVHVESKRVERLNIHEAMEQACRDAAPGKVPAVFHRKNRKPWLVTVELAQLIQFVSAVTAIVAQQQTIEENQEHGG